MVIPTPEIDWVGLAPSLILLGAGALAPSRICLLYTSDAADE